MASITKRPNGHYWVQFTDAARGEKRCTLRLGKTSQRAAEVVRQRVEDLLAAKGGLPLSHETAAWVTGLDGKLAERLAALGLIEARQAMTLQAFCTQYVTMRSDLRPATKMQLNVAAAKLVEHFGAERRLDAIRVGDVAEFAIKLRESQAENTARRLIARGKQLFGHALRKGLIVRNPFDEQRGLTVRANRERDFFVDEALAERVLEALPPGQWQLIFALARWGGLRIPSEALALRWGDIDWAAKRMIVRSPKTEHAGKAFRQLPIFPQVLPHLEQAFDAAPEGSEYVVALGRRQGGRVNLRQQFERFLVRAGIEPWPRPWQACRQTRASELASQFTQHTAADWLGHTVAVAREHYWRPSDEEFARAVESDSPSESEKAKQKAKHEALTRGDMGCEVKIGCSSQLDSLSRLTTDWQSIEDGEAPRLGNELFQESPENRGFSAEGEVKGEALVARNASAGTLRIPGDDLSHGTECLGKRADKSDRRGGGADSEPGNPYSISSELDTAHDPRLLALCAAWPSLSESQRLAVLLAAGIDAATPDELPRGNLPEVSTVADDPKTRRKRGEC